MELIEAELAEVPQGLRSGRILGEIGVSKATFYRRRQGRCRRAGPRLSGRERRDPPKLVERVRKLMSHKHTRVYGYRKVHGVLT